MLIFDMHTCPFCGKACYCNGDIEDHETDLGADGCVCECEEAMDDPDV
jgi:hypothetical protein